ncbi:HMG-Y-related protein A-like [Curcuma longa]|uniref:HMG-Y-related protein A-like n=1 Tax=Curcuma longa TaxID=136217 RepID=UPI003D9F4B73
MSSASDEDDTAYPKMIMEAISALGGADRLAISNHIDFNNSDLPRDHVALVALHLYRLTESGELLLVDEKYSKPGGSQSQAPAKRGRGRPPKPKSDVVTGAELPSPRPRGRPPKAKDPLATAVAKAAAGFPRARGRPPKAEKAAGSTPSGAVVIGVKRGRGRPPKAKPALVAEAV